MKKLLAAALLTIMLAASLVPSADATLIVFQGNDPGAGPTDPRPNANGARASFDAAAASLGTLSILNFEDLPVGIFGGGTADLGMGVTLFTFDAIFSGISDGAGSAGAGYNTTSGGTKFLQYLAEVGSVANSFLRVQLKHMEHTLQALELFHRRMSASALRMFLALMMYDSLR